MQRQRVKFPSDLFWENKTYKKKTSIVYFKISGICEDSRTSTKQRARRLAKFVRCNEVSLCRGSFFIYFTTTGKKKIMCYTEDFAMSRFFYIEVPLYFTLCRG